IHELGDLVGDLMQLSRGVLSTDSAELVDLSDVANRAIERVQRRAPDLRFTVDIDSWWVEGDPSALERAVTNLLDNAAKWSPASGEVHVILKDGQLTVADNGPGIPEADQLRVFERFYRAPDARGLPGSGLGLAIVAQTAQQHGGQVIATRANSGGAQLTMRLPGTATMPQVSQQTGSPARPSEIA
ncbi:MAG: HAMP domain-containing sensor histidine kinase, partial [Candidatus Nanopelagicales bacterium]